MKKKISIITLLLFAALSVPFSCNKDVDPKETLYPLEPSKADDDAATWTGVFISTSTYSNYLAGMGGAPVDVTTPAYQTDLAKVKQLQALVNDDKRNAISYWSDGGVLRWNQIFRELVARYNLPPAPLDDNSYPAPDADNPFADPNFPFANPPYSARAYSYVSVAMYDALKVAWYYKYQYNRQAPYQVDNTIQSLMPKVNIPAWPSEEAVMSGVAQTILSAMFPAAVEEISLKAGEQRNVAIWSGKAAPSDVSAGLALGKAIAGQFMTRAKGDGMANAVGTKAQWAALEDSARLHYTKLNDTRDLSKEVFWKSLDIPSRPPMLPFFGNVWGWRMYQKGQPDQNGQPSPSSDFDVVRSTPPPSTNNSEMADQIAEVKNFSSNLTRERLAIVHKWADGVGTYTPQGHWNDIAEEYVRDAKMSEVRAARAFALLNMAMHDAGVACWNTKYYYYNPRPTNIDPSIKTGTGIPNFPSYVSGHSSFSFAASTVLSYLFPANQTYFEAQANEAALSRLYGAIHYRIDCDMGSQLGKDVGVYTVTFAQGDGAD